jgi:hypothetical protein
MGGYSDDMNAPHANADIWDTISGVWDDNDNVIGTGRYDLCYASDNNHTAVVFGGLASANTTYSTLAHIITSHSVGEPTHA